MNRQNNVRAIRRRAVLVAAAAMALTLVAVMPAPVATAQGAPTSEELFPLVATPKFFTDATDPSTELLNAAGQPFDVQAKHVAIDPDLGGTGRAVVLTISPPRIHLFDLDTLRQQGVVGTPSATTGVIPVSGPTPKGLVLDTRRHRAFTTKFCGQGNPCQAAGPILTTISLGDSADPRDFTFPAPYNNQEIIDLSYDEDRDVVYALTTVANALNVVGVTGGVWLHAIQGGSTLLWSYRVQECGSALSTLSLPGLGVAPGFVYFLCRGVSLPGGESTAFQYVQHGVVRVNLPANNVAPVAGTDEFYAFGGDLAHGQASVDQLGQRIFVIPSGSGQRIFVFDVAHRAWTGAVPLKAVSDPNGVVVDPATGRAYGLQKSSGTNVIPNLYITDGTGVPVPQGLAMRVHGIGSSGGLPAFDSSRRRLFIVFAGFPSDGSVYVDTAQRRGNFSLAVYQDRSPLPDMPAPADPDTDTHDIDEGTAVQVTHGGSASAYGVRVLLAGGVGATPVLGPINSAMPPEATRAMFDNGDRGLYLARAGDDEYPGARLEGDSTSGTATAVATGVTIDKVTADEFATRFQESGQNPYASLTEGAEEFHTVSCKDFGEGTSTETNAGSRASCVERKQASASVSAPRSPAGLPFTVAASSSSVGVTKDPDRGIVSQSEAVAEGIGFDVPGLGGVRIGAVRATAESAAHGRPGTARSTFRAVYENVRITDATGSVVFSCGLYGGGGVHADEPCDAADVTAVISRRFRSKVQAFGPQPTTDPLETDSPGGAKAIVWEDLYRYWNDFNVNADSRREVPGLQLVFYNDGAQASRVVVQLASVFSESGYAVGDPVVEEPVDPASLSLELLDDLGAPLSGGVFEVRNDASGGTAECLTDVGGGDTELAAEESTTTTSTTSSASTTSTTVADGSVDKCPTGEDSSDGDTELAANESTTTSTSSTTSTTVGDSGSTTSSTVADGESAGAVDELTDELIPDGTCVTGDDGIGDCVFEDLAPGSYIVTQKAAPAGYAPADDFPVTLTPGFASKVSFTNLKALATIEISLTDDADPPAPLPGGEFVVLADDGDGLLGDADVELGTCTTGADGACKPFADVPLGAYVVHQSAAPNGLMPADDVAFSFDLPGQVAALAFVNGAPPVEAAPVPEAGQEAAIGGAAAVAPRPSYSQTTIIPPPPPPPPVVTSEPIKPDRPSGIGRVMALPAETVGFLARSPGQALLFAGIWSLLLAPAYLAARRRKLTLVKEGI